MSLGTINKDQPPVRQLVRALLWFDNDAMVLYK